MGKSTALGLSILGLVACHSEPIDLQGPEANSGGSTAASPSGAASGGGAGTPAVAEGPLIVEDGQIDEGSNPLGIHGGVSRSRTA